MQENENKTAPAPIWDENIATLRAFAMMHVLVIHSLFWPVRPELHSGSSIIRGLFLFEMPLFFFLTGACNNSGKRGIVDFYLSRFQRIVPAYAVYCIFGAILTFLTAIGTHGQYHGGIFHFCSVYPPPGSPVTDLPYLTWALWFVPVYLSVILVLPLFQKIYHCCRQPFASFPFAVCALILLALMFCSFPGRPQLGNICSYLVFYSFWSYLGFHYKKFDVRAPVRNKIMVIPIVIACFAVATSFVCMEKKFADMQANKFPPNFVFLAYSIGVGGLLYLFSCHLLRYLDFCRRVPILRWIFIQYSTHTYTIFLYHPLSFLFIKYLFGRLGLWETLSGEPLLCAFVHAMLAIPLGALLGRFLSWPERIKLLPAFGKWRGARQQQIQHSSHHE